MLYLSRNDLANIANRVVTKYNASCSDHVNMHSIKPVLLAEILGLIIRYAKLTSDNSILGITSYGSVSISIVDESECETCYCLDGKTILIEIVYVSCDCPHTVINVRLPGNCQHAGHVYLLPGCCECEAITRNAWRNKQKSSL